MYNCIELCVLFVCNFSRCLKKCLVTIHRVNVCKLHGQTPNESLTEDRMNFR